MKKMFSILVLAAIIATPGCAASTDNYDNAKTRIFTDSSGRDVEIPVEINSVAPTGPLSQAVLYTACPDKLCGISMDFPGEAKGFIPDEFYSLPKFGQFYGKNVNLNMEALIAAAPDVIIDIGEAKDNIAQDMEALQKQIDIPVVFIEASLDTMDNMFLLLGDLTGGTERAGRLASYCKGAVSQADEVNRLLKDDEKVRLYMAMGENGLSTNARDSFHADVIRRAGAENVVDIGSSSLGAGSEVSFEQILVWNPEVILVDSPSLYEKLSSDPIWKQVDAVQTGRIYQIPSIPYSFVTNPPAANRIIGIKWLGALLYPDQYGVDIENEVRVFFNEFYSIELTDDQYREIMRSAL